MTAHTPPTLGVSWEPVVEGLKLYMGDPQYGEVFTLNMQDVRELMYDMEEALMLARGYTKHANIEVCDVPDTWIVRVMGNDFRVASTFVEAHSKYEGAWYCLQDSEGREIVWPATDLVTAYEPVE